MLQLGHETTHPPAPNRRAQAGTLSRFGPPHQFNLQTSLNPAADQLAIVEKASLRNKRTTLLLDRRKRG
jgi:hypothetical protein